MRKRIGLLAGLTALFAVGSAHAQTCSVPLTVAATDINDETGHTFFVYKASGITWDQAQECVASLPDQAGAKAHLATITSTSENAWIVSKLLVPALVSTTNPNRLEKTQVWVGGFQGLGSAEPGGGWTWVNEEGQIAVPGTPVTLGYSNWAPGEPNNSNGVNEKHLTLGRYGDLGLWNDEGSDPGSIGGFIVEYDTPRALGDGCTTGSTVTCTTVEGQTLTFPPGTFVDGSSFTFTAYEFTDPRVNATTGRCEDRRPLTLFEGPEFNLSNGNSGKLVIPAYLCGSPKFLVVRALGTGINIPKGVVITENNTLTIPDAQVPNAPGILPDNFFDCNAPIPAGESGQTQDVGVWQSLDATEMWENAPTSSVARFAGTAAELTTGCGSTLLKTRTKSNFIVGLHIDFGPSVDPGSAAEYQEFIALTQYKISLVRQSVVNARMEGRISSADGRAMLSQLDSAAGSLATNNPVSAAKKMQDFLKKVTSSTYSTSLQNPFNYNGDHLSRGENILFTLQHKIIPFK